MMDVGRPGLSGERLAEHALALGVAPLRAVEVGEVHVGRHE